MYRTETWQETQLGACGADLAERGLAVHAYRIQGRKSNYDLPLQVSRFTCGILFNDSHVNRLGRWTIPNRWLLGSAGS